MTSSALLVHVWDGVIEAHFHFFVMVVVLALYEDWLVFLVAAAYVVVHHAGFGVLHPDSVYNHPDAIAHPLKWALIHGLFVTAAGIAGVVGWRFNEIARAQLQDAHAVLEEAQALAGVGSWEWDVATDAVEWSTSSGASTASSRQRAADVRSACSPGPTQTTAISWPTLWRPRCGRDPVRLRLPHRARPTGLCGSCTGAARCSLGDDGRPCRCAAPRRT